MISIWVEHKDPSQLTDNNFLSITKKAQATKGKSDK
jgi:hypothetical protein